MKPLIGFIGQGWIGRHYADDFEYRGFPVIRYSLEPQHIHNRARISKCDIVFIAVPTPTTPKGHDYSTVQKVLRLVGPGKVAVIKSTLIPGVQEKLQKKYPKLIVLHSPEFLVESTAARDAANPDRNIIGIIDGSRIHQDAARRVLEILPKSPFVQICNSREAELIKYVHNVHGYIQVVFSNMLHDLAGTMGADWEEIKKACIADPMMSNYYLNPIHKSGRGAGGGCFIKDFKAFADLYESLTGDKNGSDVLRSVERKNIELLKKSKKDIHLLKQVYGDDIKDLDKPKMLMLAAKKKAKKPAKKTKKKKATKKMVKRKKVARKAAKKAGKKFKKKVTKKTIKKKTRNNKRR